MDNYVTPSTEPLGGGPQAVGAVAVVSILLSIVYLYAGVVHSIVAAIDVVTLAAAIRTAAVQAHVYIDPNVS